MSIKNEYAVLKSLLENKKSQIIDNKMKSALFDKLDIGDDGENVQITEACYLGNNELIERLINGGADINARRYAIRMEGMKIYTTGQPPLLTAIDGGNYETVKLLLGKGADVNAQITQVKENLDEEFTLTALMLSIYRDPRIMELLIENGADEYKRADDGYSVSDVFKNYANYGISKDTKKIAEQTFQRCLNERRKKEKEHQRQGTARNTFTMYPPLKIHGAK